MPCSTYTKSGSFEIKDYGHVCPCCSGDGGRLGLRDEDLLCVVLEPGGAGVGGAGGGRAAARAGHRVCVEVGGRGGAPALVRREAAGPGLAGPGNGLRRFNSGLFVVISDPVLIK